MTAGTIDLHMHSTVSDGTDEPEKLISLVREAGIRVFSLTDHDALKGCEIIKSALRDGDPAFITGVEFSCKDEKGKYHILGYGYDPSSEPIRAVVEHGHSIRMKKAAARLDCLKTEYNFDFSDEDVQTILSLDNPGKPHIANLMVKYGYAETKKEAFRNYIDKLKIKSEHVRPEEAIDGILKSGGIPVLAHPAYGDGDQLIIGDELDERLRRLIAFGLRGVEAYYSGFSKKLRKMTLSYAEKYNLLVTAGSDYHGKNKLVRLGDVDVAAKKRLSRRVARFLDEVR